MRHFEPAGSALSPVLIVILVSSSFACVQATPVTRQQMPDREESASVVPPTLNQESVDSRELAVYALSRGKGVPDEARAALIAAQRLFTQLRESGQVLRVVEQRIGLEGERRICAEFVHAKDAAAAREQLSAMSWGVDLFNVVMEACDRASQPHGERL